MQGARSYIRPQQGAVFEVGGGFVGGYTYGYYQKESSPDW